MRIVVDQLHRKVEVPDNPKRIISLVPSQTELLYDLGLNDNVVGITKFCVHPDHWFKTKTKIGSTKNFWFDKIKELKPDLIIGNKEENYKEGIDHLAAYYPVWMSDVEDMSSALKMIFGISQLVNQEKQGIDLVDRIKDRFSALIRFKPLRAAYLIWYNPMMLAGKNTFINIMMESLGLKNVVDISRYPELTLDQLRKLNPEVIFLSSEPYPFNSSHLQQFKSALPDTIVMMVDGEPFSWYGSRLLQAPNYFNSLPLAKL